MAEDAGSVYSEVRLKLDNLTSDIMTVCKKFDAMGQNMLAGVNRPSEQIKATIKSLTAGIESQQKKMAEITGGKELKKYYEELEAAIKKAEKAGDAEAWAVAQGQKEAVKEIEKTINSLERQKAAAEKAVVKAQGHEEEARLASINSLQEAYSKKLDEINHLYELGVVSARDRDAQIQAAQMQEIQGLEKLRASYQGFDKELEKIDKRMKEQAKNMQASSASNKTGAKSFGDLKGSLLSAVPGVGALVAAFKILSEGIKAAIQFAKESIAAYQAQEAASARLNAVIKATGANAWTTGKQMKDLAKEQSSATGQSVEDIQKMQAVLLGFTSITGDTFSRATEGIINMTAVMGGDLASAANQFGKALDSPAESLGTLSRYGFKFTEQQKELVKELEAGGKHAEAQAVILESMERAFGSAAVEINKAVISQNNYNAALENLKKAAGAKIETLVTPIRSLFTSLINSIAEAVRGSEELYENMRRVAEAASINPMDMTLEGTIEYLNAQIAVTRFELDKLVEGIGYNESLAIQRIASAIQESIGGDEGREAARRFGQEFMDEINSYTGTDYEENAARVYQEFIQRRVDALAEYEQQLAELQERQRGNANVASVFDLNESNTKNFEDEINRRREAFEKIKEDYRNELAVIEDYVNRGLITADEAQVRKASATAKEVADIAKLKQEYQELGEIQRYINDINEQIRNGDPEGVLAGQIAALQGLQGRYHALQAEVSGAFNSQGIVQIVDERKAAEIEIARLVKGYAENIEDLEAAEKDLLDIEHRRALEALMLSDNYRKAWDDKRQEAEEIINQYYAVKKLQEANKEIRGHTEEYESKIKEINHEMERQVILNSSLLNERQKQEAIIDKEAGWAIEAIEATQAWADADQDTRDAMIIKIMEWAEASKRAISDVEEKIETLGGYFKKYGAQLFSSSISLFESIASASTAFLKKEIEEQTKLLDKKYQEDKDRLDKEMQDKLYRLGLVEAATQEQYEADLQKAIESGDQRSIFEADEALRRYEIEEEYSEKQKALKDELERSKAQLQYKAEMAQWKMKLVSAAASAAQAVIQAYAALPGWPLNAPFVAFAAAAGAAQLAAIKAAQPVLQFAAGGIVPGSSYSGDNIMTRQNSREMDLTLDQQKTLFNAINSGSIGGGVKTIVVPVYLDGKIITKVVVDNINDRQELIKEASVVR